MEKINKIIEGKIEYNLKKYSFYYINNILTLIPDDSLKNVWESLFWNKDERTNKDEMLIEGITNTGCRIIFINVKLTEESGGLYKGFVPAYIIRFDQIEKYIDKLYFSINQKGVYRNYYDLNVEEETKITINKYHNISSAFESWFDINFPKFKSKSDENYLIIKNNILEYINNNKESALKEEKEIWHLFKLEIERMDGTLKEQIKYALQIFEECIRNVKSNLLKYYNIQYPTNEINEKIANTFKNTRNKIAHGSINDEILFSEMDAIAYSLIERIVKCMILYKSGLPIDNIKELVDDKF